MPEPTLTLTPAGLYCPPGDFYIDPWQPVTRAVITHAHSDHARPGSRHYLTTTDGLGVLQLRIDANATIHTIPYGKPLQINGVTLSLHPAGHLLGSAQIRIEHNGHITVISGDYKTEPDRTCTPFEPIRCHHFITESTFGLPIYRWRPQHQIFTAINHWWQTNQAAGRTSILYAYALGKAQRLLAGIDPTIGPILAHGAVERFHAPYTHAGIPLPPTLHAESTNARTTRGKALVIAPPSSAGMAAWLRKFGNTSEAFASGWMQIRGARRRRAIDRGFILSDHADWNGLLATIAATGAERVDVTHGYTAPLQRWLHEHGLESHILPTRWQGEQTETETEPDTHTETHTETEPDTQPDTPDQSAQTDTHTQ